MRKLSWRGEKLGELNSTVQLVHVGVLQFSSTAASRREQNNNNSSKWCVRQNCSWEFNVDPWRNWLQRSAPEFINSSHKRVSAIYSRGGYSNQIDGCAPKMRDPQNRLMWIKVKWSPQVSKEAIYICGCVIDSVICKMWVQLSLRGTRQFEAMYRDDEIDHHVLFCMVCKDERVKVMTNPVHHRSWGEHGR